ncbi:(4Fe-4S)-binding protein [Winogradskyella sp. UBA3174]|uniref:(4Fe-4S)-binding protein n=1 Tax=Winogradskyella sp. UBA3174 TaxID=1947785 RepID=UPI0025F94CE0|nr:(4Fe-4S)-binding protein [Winogradskyella sp. UBA3174]|tara:strand:- start:2655 stop:2885 length:231 start_codon:yes stop_codon:yes gene_type:complete
MDINANVFSNEEITVTYKPCCCTNAGICAKQLSNVFRNSVIPWIDLEGEQTDAIINQINKCPSGALQYYFNQKDVA